MERVERVATSDIAIGDGRSLRVVWHEDECFASMMGLCDSFGMSAGGLRGYLSKNGITTAKMDDLKRELHLSGKIRFLNRASLVRVLDDRVKDQTVLIAAKQSLLNAPVVAPVVAPVAPVVAPIVGVAVHGPCPEAAQHDQLDANRSAEHSDVQQPEAPQREMSPPPPEVPPPPRPINRVVIANLAVPLPHVPVVQQLTIPLGDAWYHSDDYAVGKSYTLPHFDRGDALVEQLRQFRVFWTREDMPARQSDALSLVTLDKREKRLLLYLGFLRIIKAVDEPRTLTLNACINHHAVQAFIEWLSKGRDSSQGNLVEYLSSFVSVAKFLYRSVSIDVVGSDFDRVEVVQRFREIRNRLQSKQSRVHKTEDDLRDEGRWLSWSTFEEAIVALQAQFNEASSDEEFPSKASARVLHDLVMLRYYAACPSRSGEVRLLQFIPFDELTELKGKLTVARYIERERINLISKRPLGAWTVWLADYKTFKSRGVDEASFTEELFGELNAALNQYLLGGYRDCLVGGGRHRYVFVNNKAAGFESSSFSHYLSALLFKLTGCKSTSNVLRSSFVVNLLQSPEGHNPGVRESAANLMRHSQAQQSKVYDRRNPTDRKRVIQSFIGKRARDDDDDGDDDRQDRRAPKAVAARFKRGDLVVVPYHESRTRTAMFWFAKVMGDDGAEVSLMELQPTGNGGSGRDGGGYRANLKSVWKEPSSVVFHVDSELDRETGLYMLLSTEKEILALLNE